MPNYRRASVKGGTYFFTVVTHNRKPILCEENSRETLKACIHEIRKEHPFTIDAWVLLPDHIHCIWTLPRGDNDFSIRWRLVKRRFTMWYRKNVNETLGLTKSRRKRGEQGIWQRRFWEHLIRDETDFKRHCDYIHYNPVKHGYVKAPKEWGFSTFDGFVKKGVYDIEWGAGVDVVIDENVGKE